MQAAGLHFGTGLQDTKYLLTMHYTMPCNAFADWINAFWHLQHAFAKGFHAYTPDGLSTQPLYHSKWYNVCPCTLLHSAYRLHMHPVLLFYQQRQMQQCMFSLLACGSLSTVLGSCRLNKAESCRITGFPHKISLKDSVYTQIKIMTDAGRRKMTMFFLQASLRSG